METKQILKEEMAKSAKILKSKGVELGKDALEAVVVEMIEMSGRVAIRTNGKADDILLAIKPILLNEADKINGKEG